VIEASNPVTLLFVAVRFAGRKSNGKNKVAGFPLSRE
jgi:hypothetical protein